MRIKSAGQKHRPNMLVKNVGHKMQIKNADRKCRSKMPVKNAGHKMPIKNIDQKCRAKLPVTNASRKSRRVILGVLFQCFSTDRSRVRGVVLSTNVAWPQKFKIPEGREGAKKLHTRCPHVFISGTGTSRQIGGHVPLSIGPTDFPIFGLSSSGVFGPPCFSSSSPKVSRKLESPGGPSPRMRFPVHCTVISVERSLVRSVRHASQSFLPSSQCQEDVVCARLLLPLALFVAVPTSSRWSLPLHFLPCELWVVVHLHLRDACAF